MEWWPRRAAVFRTLPESLPICWLLLPTPGSFGGAEGIRTPDLRRAKAALSQLSYGPNGQSPVSSPGSLVPPALTGRSERSRPSIAGLGLMVGHDGLEPSASVLSGLRSNHLS